MSDNSIRLVPQNPRFLPDELRRARAHARLSQLMPSAQTSVQIYQAVQFIDCGANFESVNCPSCGAQLSIEWWHDRMAEDYDGNGFRLASYATPCCTSRLPLYQLDYNWPQAFARFLLEATNPLLPQLADADKRELEHILGTRLILIYRHL